MLYKNKKQDKKIDYTKLVCVHTNVKILEDFRRLGDFIRSIYFDDISLEQAINRQDKMEYLLRSLEAYKPKSPDKIKSKRATLKNASKSLNGRNFIVFAFENIFPLTKKRHINMKNGQKKKTKLVLLISLKI